MLVFSVALLLPFVSALATTANRRESASSISIPISAYLNSGKELNIVEADLARVHSLLGCSTEAVTTGLKHRQATAPLTDKAVIGSPPTTYSLLVDTGSSNTWVGADPNNSYVPTSTSFNTNEPVTVVYGSGSFSGTEYFDVLTLAPNFVVNQSIGVASTSSGLSDDGILGIGPTDLTNGTVVGSKIIPTIVDSLYDQGLIDSKRVSVFFQPTLGSNDPNGVGQLDFGGVDFDKVVGPITFAPITRTLPAGKFWGINQTIGIFSQSDILPNSAGIVDTGTTLVLLANETFNHYQQAVGASLDNATGLLKVTKEQFLSIPSLLFTIGGTIFEFTRDAQAWPQQLNTEIGGDADGIYLIVSNLGTPVGEGLDFILGQTFLQRFYTIYDTDNQQVGFSLTAHTFDFVNVPL